MTIEILVVFALIVAAMVLFAMESVSYDLVAMILAVSLMVTGILDVKEGLSGLANPATVTIAAMFALSRGIRNTGVLQMISGHLGRIRNLALTNGTLIVMAIIALVSAFINNTAAVVIFIPVLMTVAAHMSVSPSKLLIPLSFASMFGGVCTLLGTSTNILVSSIATENGLKPFGMFEFTPFGLIIVAAGFLYLYAAGIRMVPPRRKSEDLSRDFNTVAYLSDVKVTDEFGHLGEPLRNVENGWDLDIEVLFIYRDDEAVSDIASTELQAGDILRIRGGAAEIHKLVQRKTGLQLRPELKWEDVDVTRDDYELIEAVVSPDSDYEGRKPRQIPFNQKFGAVMLGIYRGGKNEQKSLNEILLQGGDSILLAAKGPLLMDLKKDDNFVVVSDVPVEKFRYGKLPVALGILLAVIVTSAVGVAPIVVSACAGVILMVVTGCIRTAEIHQSIHWKVIFLLAGVIPLGLAMQKTGAARMLSDLIVQTVGHLGPRAVMSGYFLLTTLLTAMISNQATAAILASLAIETAEGMGVAARPFLMAVTYAASLSLITPWGYQTNTLIFGPGRYRFTDFTKVGGPLNLLFWILGTIFIPVFWSF